jgi:hypothetical protein
MAIVHPAFCEIGDNWTEPIATPEFRFRRLRSRIQNIAKTACTAQEALTYFRPQSTPPDNKKIEREQP